MKMKFFKCNTDNAQYRQCTIHTMHNTYNICLFSQEGSHRLAKIGSRDHWVKPCIKTKQFQCSDTKTLMYWHQNAACHCALGWTVQDVLFYVASKVVRRLIACYLMCAVGMTDQSPLSLLIELACLLLDIALLYEGEQACVFLFLVLNSPKSMLAVICF